MRPAEASTPVRAKPKSLSDSLYQVVRTTVNGHAVTIVVEGTGEVHPLRDLADNLAATLGRPVVVDLRVIPSPSGVRQPDTIVNRSRVIDDLL